nr:MAG TPA: major tail protein [Caudoviricetes sp.]
MYWIRQIEVKAGGKLFESIGDNALDIEFDIPFSDKNEPDVSTISIYNLSEDSINSIEKQGNISVSAGYRDMHNVAEILSGQIESIKTEWQSLDKVTTITISDGAKAWRKKEFSKTYKNNTKASSIMSDLCNALGYPVSELKPKKDITYPLGKTITGVASKSLIQLAKDTESKMFINKGRIVIRPEKEGYKSGILLNADSGLLDTPTLNENNTGDQIDSAEGGKSNPPQKSRTVKCLLNPQIETDMVINIESRSINGAFRVKSGKHSKDFITELEVVEA